ncbi:MAG: GxxExxY protein [Gemmatimonadota bacterium]
MPVIDHNRIASIVIDAGFRISRKLGPGLLESVYKTVLARDLIRSGLCVECEKWISFDFEGLWFDKGFRADIIVARAVIVEVKCAVALNAAHYKQILTYLRLTDMKLGLLLNFGAPHFKDGIKRVVNGL